MACPKVLREVMETELADAKGALERLPAEVLVDVARRYAEQAVEALRAAGCDAEVVTPRTKGVTAHAPRRLVPLAASAVRGTRRRGGARRAMNGDSLPPPRARSGDAHCVSTARTPMARHERVLLGFRTGLLLLLLPLWAACREPPTATEILVVVDTDMALGTELTQIDVAVFDRDGTEAIAGRPYRLSAEATETTRTLPLSFSIAPTAQESSRDIRVVVTGWGRIGTEMTERQVVEQQAIVAFRAGKAQRLDLYLNRNCLQKLCREQAGLTCDPQTAACIVIPERMALPPSKKGDGLSGYERPTFDVPGAAPTGTMTPNACAADAGCAPSGSCPTGACANGSCRAGASGWECVCSAGFVGTGTQQCTPEQVCAVPPEAQPADVSRPTTVVGSGTPASCTSSAFVAAVAKGGIITFNCGPDPVTITLTETAKVVNDKSPYVVIDGGGKVTLSGGGGVRILYLNTCDERQVLTTPNCDNQQFPQLTVQNLTFEAGNATSVGDGGGAIYAQGGRLKVVNCQFRGNVCTPTGKAAAGGAIRAFQQYNGQPVYVVNSRFGGQAAHANTCSSGGAIASTGVSFRILNSFFSHNKATGIADPANDYLPGGGNGGALAIDGNAFSLELCGVTLEQNSANEGGGALAFISNDRTGTLRITRSTLRNNPSGRFETSPGIFALAQGDPKFGEGVIP